MAAPTIANDRLYDKSEFIVLFRILCHCEEGEARRGNPLGGDRHGLTASQ